MVQEIVGTYIGTLNTNSLRRCHEYEDKNAIYIYTMLRLYADNKCNPKMNNDIEQGKSRP